MVEGQGRVGYVARVHYHSQEVVFVILLFLVKLAYFHLELALNLEVLGDRLKVTLKNTGGGLKTRDGKAPSHFEIIGIGIDDAPREILQNGGMPYFFVLEALSR